MRDEKKPKPKTKNQKPIYAKKSFGQNFLVDQNYIGKIISALNPQKDETIIEIGAGRGALTEKLVESGANVLAIEFERDMIAILRGKFAENESFQIVEQDALKIDFSELTKTKDQRPKTKLVANLPYNISTAILQKLIEQKDCFSEMVLMFQREVVERITAEAGNKERGFLSVLVQTYLEAEKLFDVSPNAFRPAPKVWSSVVRLQPKEENEIGIADKQLFREIVSLGFRQKRKTIFNNLKNSGEYLSEVFENNGGIKNILERVQIEESRRAETLTLEEWKRLSNFLIQ
ncbi:MAG: 16S rRNA (adenine(1518)-N(6)/adenine(1519)-N(6))-dimethyltransferase RsmA [Pyrinomonadaceae bacterium]